MGGISGMGRISDSEVQAIIARVKERLNEAGGTAPGRSLLAGTEVSAAAAAGLGDGIFAGIDECVAAAQTAFEAYRDLGLAARRTIVEAIRVEMRAQADRLARMAHAETGLGRVEDKLRKNLLVANKTPGPEDLEPETVTGDEGMMMTEYAPYGVIGSITPTTNPTSTIINNSISIVSAGNAVVFNVHPNAKAVSAENIRLINRAIVGAGGPPNLLTGVADPTIETAEQLMHHPGVRVLLVTGGPGVVKAALETDKKVIAAGPGNPPAVVDETADVEQAGRDIVAGASFDNNVICTDEKSTIAVEPIADRLVRAMSRSGGYRLQGHEIAKLERVIFRELGPPNKPGRINPAWIGKDAGVILAEIGVHADPEPRLLIAEVPIEHSLLWTEQMMPVMPVVRVRDVHQGIDLAVRSEHGFRHTASIHSTNVATITKMARAINCSIFVANGPNYSGLGEGGEGFASFSIASPTGEGLTRARTFSRRRRISVVGALRIV